MQISSVPNQALSTALTPLPQAPQGTADQQGKSNAVALPLNREAANQDLAQPETGQSGNSTEKITLSAQAYTGNETTAPANDANEDTSAVFAEIWKNGVKVAVVDDRGSVTSLNGMPVSQFQSSGGTGLAAQRAARIAIEIGGEIRVGGMSLDGPTLVMRDRLRSAYGI